MPAWSDFISQHTLLIAFGFISLFIIWKFLIQPRLKMTDKEIGDTFRKSVEEIVDNVSVNQDDLMDANSMPDFSYDLDTKKVTRKKEKKK